MSTARINLLRGHSSAVDLADAIRAESARPPEQVAFPWVPPPEPRATPATPDRTAWLVDVELLLLDVAELAEWIALDRRRLCRCLNQASCLCEASNVARDYRARAKALLPRLQRAVAPSKNRG